MKKYLYKLLPALFLFVVLLPMQVRAAGRSGIRLDETGTVTVVLPQAAQEGISTLGFSLSVESSGEAAAEFQFDGNTAEILEYRYDGNTRKLNVYVAGTEALFTEGADSLTVGRVMVRDANGRETTARVSVVENSLQYVHETELKTVTDMDLPGTVQIGSSSTVTPVVTPPVTQSPVATQFPSVTQSPTVTQAPEEPEESQDGPAVSQPPAASPVQTPARTPGTASRPQSTKVPVGSLNAGGASSGSGSSSQTAGSTPGPSGSSLPAGTPEKEEDGFIFSRSPEGEDTDQKTGAKGMDVILTIAVIVIVIVIVIEAAAFVVIKRKPKK